MAHEEQPRFHYERSEAEAVRVSGTESAGEKGVAVHAIGGTDNHIHIAVSVPPTLGISRWIGELKGASSHYVNQSLLNRKGGLEWQSGHGVVSFSTRDIPRVVEYIAAQGDIHQHRMEKWKREHYQGALARNRP